MHKSSLYPGLSLYILEVKNFSFSFSATRALFNHIFLDRLFIHNLLLLDLIDIDATLPADPGSLGYIAQLQTFDVEGIFAPIAKNHFGLVMFL